MEGTISAFEYSRRYEKASAWARRLITFPFVEKVSLTGSMAAKSAKKNSDIDLFVQVRPGNLWWARLAITIWVHLAGERRTQLAIANKLCLNWFATFDGPSAQGRPYVVLAEDPWPLGIPAGRDVKSRIKIKKSKFKKRAEIIIGPLSPLLEFMARNLQYNRFIRDSRTFLPGSEVRFSDQELGFHPPKFTRS